VLLVGDSWAWYIDQFDALDQVFAASGHADVGARGATTAIPGTTTADWNGASLRNALQAEIQNHPEIDVIHLYLGGNDVLGAWNTSYTTAQEDALFQQMATNLQSLITFIHGLDPTLEIVYGTYDYVNLEEMRQQNVFDLLLWLNLGSPTPLELNQVMARGTAAIFAAIGNDPMVHLQNHSGLMQWAFGDPLRGLAPHSVPLPGRAPGYRPRLGGIPTQPSPARAMTDGIHLNQQGYMVLAAHDTREFYDAWFNAHP